jgi:hypothetical protein
MTNKQEALHNFNYADANNLRMDDLGQKTKATIRAALTEAPNTDTITLSRAEFEAVKAALIEARNHMHGFPAIDQALTILSKHGETK